MEIKPKQATTKGPTEWFSGEVWLDPLVSLPSDPTLTILGQSGKALTSAYQLDPQGSWPIETALDVEWSHAVAPGAKIVLVESVDAFPTNLYAAVNTARYMEYRGPNWLPAGMSYGKD